MTKGIFNPFRKPPPDKKNFQSPIGKEPYDTEYGAPEENIRLDGDSFVIEFQNTKLEDIPSKLANIISSVIQEHREFLNDYGIDLRPKSEQRPLEDGELVLPTQAGQLYVYVGLEGTQIEAFRRIGYVLHKLPVSDILKNNRVKVIARA